MSVVTTKWETTNLYLLGTVHVSKQSVINASDLVEAVKPSVLFLELCDQRQGLLLADNETARDKQPRSIKQMYDLFKRDDTNAFTILYSFFIRYIEDEIGVRAGGEFKSAYETGLKTSCPALVLGDRPMSITINRLWNGFSIFQKLKLLFHLFGSPAQDNASSLSAHLEKLENEKDVLSMEIKAVADRLPWFFECLINERDQYMAIKLHNTIQKMQLNHVPGDVVAIVGCGHVEGVLKHYERVQQMDEAELRSAHRRVMRVPIADSDFTIKDLRVYAGATSATYLRVSSTAN